jgi:trk system potassium uptake protein TrkH
MSMLKDKVASYSDCGKLMILVGILTAVPLLDIPFYPQDGIFTMDFVIPALVSILLGLLLGKITLQSQENIFEWRYVLKYSSRTVLFAWCWGILIGALPFVLGGRLGFLQAIFESVSGWTTTGLSVIDVTVTPHIYLLHRSFMQFCGGMGFVMMMLMVAAGRQAVNLYNAEGHPDKLRPNLRKTAQTVFAMFAAFQVIGTLAYCVAGMPVFDSICHTMCALSTGGFSTKLNSIGDYHSFTIEIVTVVLMLLGTTNFAVLGLLTKGKWKRCLKVSEVRFMFGLLAVTVPLIAVALSAYLKMSLATAVRQSLFNVVSALSTTGYSTMDYSTWPPFALGVLIVIMLIGGGIGSTAGGIKMARVYLLLRLVVLNLRQRLSSARIVRAPYYIKAQGKTPIDHVLAEDTVTFIASYLMIFIVGSLALTLTAGCDLTKAMFEFASSLGTVGLSIGMTGPTTGAGTLLVEIVGMVLGRLEIYVVLISMYSFLVGKAD